MLCSPCVVTTAAASQSMIELLQEIDNMQNVAFGRVACRYSPHTSSGHVPMDMYKAALTRRKRRNVRMSADGIYIYIS